MIVPRFPRKPPSSHQDSYRNLTSHLSIMLRHVRRFRYWWSRAPYDCGSFHPYTADKGTCFSCFSNHELVLLLLEELATSKHYEWFRQRTSEANICPLSQSRPPSGLRLPQKTWDSSRRDGDSSGESLRKIHEGYTSELSAQSAAVWTAERLIECRSVLAGCDRRALRGPRSSPQNHQGRGRVLILRKRWTILNKKGAATVARVTCRLRA